MSQVQLRAGFVIEAIQDHLGHRDKAQAAQEVLRHLTAFDLEVEGPVGPNPADDPLLAVADNILCRGFPTLPSLRVERRVAEVAGLTEEKCSNGEISFPFEAELDSEEKMVLRQALLPIDPGLSPAMVGYFRDTCKMST